jgi:hypothetical protein
VEITTTEIIETVGTIIGMKEVKVEEVRDIGMIETIEMTEAVGAATVIKKGEEAEAEVIGMISKERMTIETTIILPVTP